MDKDRKHSIVIYYIMPSMIFLLLINLSFALGPPPVDQKMGIYDTLFANLADSSCRNCHTSGVLDRYHMLIQIEEYECNNCHLIVTINESHQINLTMDCKQCHDTIYKDMVNVIIKDRKGSISRIIEVANSSNITIDIVGINAIIGSIVNVNSIYSQ